ncbi:hypothetical protein BTG_04255 [Bacillus thuringiensis HD-771]|uniref:Uncharacterized protein n=1 Tax=Bacillus thuringiensis HD-771 TaxID=1218175 RepID=A0A9W3JAC0_BACTU|nr:hypothetical protein BTG_04255 [Bacillus thuringiensis HD-771]
MKTIIKNIGNKNIKAKVEEPLIFHAETLFNLLSKVEYKLDGLFIVYISMKSIIKLLPGIILKILLKIRRKT